jgi:hypothetical protein
MTSFLINFILMLYFSFLVFFNPFLDPQGFASYGLTLEVPRVRLSQRVLLPNCYESNTGSSTGGEQAVIGLFNESQFYLSMNPFLFTRPINVSVKILSLFTHIHSCSFSNYIPSFFDSCHDHAHNHDCSCSVSFDHIPDHVPEGEIHKVLSPYPLFLLKNWFNGLCTCFNESYQTRKKK